jgi:hypothetical protein
MTSGPVVLNFGHDFATSGRPVGGLWHPNTDAKLSDFGPQPDALMALDAHNSDLETIFA